MTGLGARFWPKVDIRGPAECWPWKRMPDRYGYGRFRLNPRKDLKAHRLAFELVHGYPPRVGRHSCDNPICCNPLHIIDGTVANNNADMVARGRHVHGERHPSTSLTLSDVAEIRRAYDAREVSQRAIGERFGITQQSVSAIVRGRTWL